MKAIDAMKFLKRAKLADRLLNAMKEVQIESESDDLEKLESKYFM